MRVGGVSLTAKWKKKYEHLKAWKKCNVLIKLVTKTIDPPPIFFTGQLFWPEVKQLDLSSGTP